MAPRLNLGAHLSIAGGVDRAPLRGAEAGCECIQVFTTSNRQWKARPLPDDEIARFRENCRLTGVGPVFSHASYLINLASADARVRRRSERAFAEELDRCERLGIRWVIAHPGACADERVGLDRIAASLGALFERTRGRRVGILLETTTGAGGALGGRFEHLAHLLRAVDERERLGVCFDTCHAFAAGYDLRTPAAFRRTFEAFDRVIGLARLRAFHLNDSRGGLGSHVDRHEHIGRGRLGERAFALLMRSRRFRPVPKVLETPKGTANGRDWDAVNLDTLRRLARRGVR